MTESLDLQSVIAGVAIHAVYGALVFVAKWTNKRLERSYPDGKKIVVSVAVLFTLASNVALYYFCGRLFPLFGTTFLALVFYVFWGQLKQFWEVGLIGADRTIRDGIDYQRSLSMCYNSMSFLGVGARKLTEVSPGFEEAMGRCNRENRPIRFLLCPPDSPILEKAARGAGQAADEYKHRVVESLRVIADIRARRMWNIEVRFYEIEVPLFRLMFIDEWLCLASHYVFGEGDGSAWPQLHVRRSASGRDVNSLYHPFSEYFEQLWDAASPWNFREYIPGVDH